MTPAALGLLLLAACLHAGWNFRLKRCQHVKKASIVFSKHLRFLHSTVNIFCVACHFYYVAHFVPQ